METDQQAETAAPEIQLLKIREMRDILRFTLEKKEAGEELLVPDKPTQGFDKQSYLPHELRKEVEPWLTALFQSEHFSLLTGAGLTTAVHKRVTGKLPKGFTNRTYAIFRTQIQAESKRSAKQAGRGDSNPEDQLRCAIKLAEGLRILLHGTEDKDHWKSLKDSYSKLEEEISDAIGSLVKGVLASENGIATSTKSQEEALRLLVSFLMSFASRTGTRDRLHIFTINYERLLEFGAELAGIRLIDRFVGSLMPVFRASRLDIDLHYNPPGIRGEPRYLEGVARFTKLHGSIDWIDEQRQVRRVALPFGSKDYEPYIEHGAKSVLIYPNDAKDRETADYPYVELHRDFAAAVCRPNSVLVTYGYSFGDDHINRVISDMLTIPSTHLVILNYGDTGGRITNFYAHSKRPSQISVLIGNHLGDLGNLVDYYLPKPAIDRASIRMAELLRARGLGEKPLPTQTSTNGENADRAVSDKRGDDL